MKYNEKNPPLVCMQTQSTCYTKTIKFTPKGVLWHTTGAENAYISRYVQPSDNAPDKDKMLAILGKNKYGNDWNHIERKAGLNCWVGKLTDGTVSTIQSMPWNFRPWGCGGGTKGSLNDTHIQFEICEDNLKNKDYFEKVYKEGCEITAYICKLYNIDPLGYIMYNNKIKVPTICCHQDSYKLALGSNHSDVYHWFDKYDKSMQDVRNDVKKLLDNEGDDDDVVRYYDLKDIPTAYKPTIEKLVLKGIIAGNEKGLDLSDDMCRILVYNDRAGMYK